MKSESSPIRVHVNDMMNLKNADGTRRYNFHVKESTRGFEGRTELENKVRVWTFCGAKVRCPSEGPDIAPLHFLLLRTAFRVSCARARARACVRV